MPTKGSNKKSVWPTALDNHKASKQSLKGKRGK